MHYVENLVAINKHEDQSRQSISNVGTISEKALKGKALSHQASLWKRQSIRNVKIFDFYYVDPQRKPLPSSISDIVPEVCRHAFEDFLLQLADCSSSDTLKSLCIIPRSPSPIPLEDIPLNKLTPDEIKELLGRQRVRIIQV
ncbi:hypothetical protein K469DRAFT_181530 [Zopfia rhizophila CBS 207.26]|uniref:DUF7918 domain-containing protein n=1 Tax=Zopfia rhizophila CBS 207.26 TaxID=1314779 RepID=A0A6A6E1H2_9PEZI|nr:hypothetical protein K469DRAFT_181530 [Zopfia rhizophila CBS 207.26]